MWADIVFISEEFTALWWIGAMVLGVILTTKGTY